MVSCAGQRQARTASRVQPRTAASRKANRTASEPLAESPTPSSFLHELPLRLVYASRWERYEDAALGLSLKRPAGEVLAGLLLGSVGLAVAGQARCPVIVARGDKAGLAGTHERASTAQSSARKLASDPYTPTTRGRTIVPTTFPAPAKKCPIRHRCIVGRRGQGRMEPIGWVARLSLKRPSGPYVTQAREGCVA